MDIFSPTTKTVGISATLQTIPVAVPTLQACDEFGQCATETIAAPIMLSDASAILTPTIGSVFKGFAPITIEGYLRSDSEVRAVNVTVDGQSVYSTTWSPGGSETTWSTFWTPSLPGDYVLEATLTNGSGQKIIDPADTVITVTNPDMMETILINNVGSAWGQVNFTYSYTDPVVVCSVNYSNNSVPEVVRLRDVSAAGFQLRLQNPGDQAALMKRLASLSSNPAAAHTMV